MTKMNHPVNWGNGLIKTPREMLDQGLAKVVITENWGTRNGKRKAVFVETPNGYCIEVSGFVKAQS